MTDNLFLDAIDSDKLNEINAIKTNKAFALRIINDLRKVFRTYERIEDASDSTSIDMKRTSTSNYYNCFSLLANKKGLFFIANCLGYYGKDDGSSIKPLGKLYEKYIDLSTANDCFKVRHDHGQVVIRIKLDENDIDLKDKLKDIVYLMEQNQFTKVF
jgi:hypothetical protein